MALYDAGDKQKAKKELDTARKYKPSADEEAKIKEWEGRPSFAKDWFVGFVGARAQVWIAHQDSGASVPAQQCVIIAGGTQCSLPIRRDAWLGRNAS